MSASKIMYTADKPCCSCGMDHLVKQIQVVCDLDCQVTLGFRMECRDQADHKKHAAQQVRRVAMLFN